MSTGVRPEPQQPQPQHVVTVTHTVDNPFTDRDTLPGAIRSGHDTARRQAHAAAVAAGAPASRVHAAVASATRNGTTLVITATAHWPADSH